MTQPKKNISDLLKAEVEATAIAPSDGTSKDKLLRKLLSPAPAEPKEPTIRFTAD